MKMRAFVVMGFGVAAMAFGCTVGPDKDGPLGSTESALNAPVTLIGPGPVIVDAQGTDYQQIDVDLAHSQTLAAGTYVAESFSYQFSLFDSGPGLGFGTPRGSITPLLLTFDGSNYTPVAIGAPVTYAGPTAFISTSFGGSGTFTLAASTTIYAGLYWYDPPGSTPGPDRMPVGCTLTTGSTFILYSSPTGAGGANPPVVGTPISGFGGAASGIFQRAYNFDIGVSPQTSERSIEICHHPPGNPTNVQDITVGASAVPAHLAHGDSTGPCTTAPITFTAWLGDGQALNDAITAAEQTYGSRNPPAVTIPYTSVQQNSNLKVFSPQQDGSVIILKSGSIVTSATLTMGEPSGGGLTLQCAVNGQAMGANVVPGGAMYTMSVNFSWTANAGDTLACSLQAPFYTGAVITTGSASALSMQWSP
jgi:hypothetical protein